jgi:hypothetical protein
LNLEESEIEMIEMHHRHHEDGKEDEEGPQVEGEPESPATDNENYDNDNVLLKRNSGPAAKKLSFYHIFLLG